MPRVFTFEDRGAAVVLCPRISECTGRCSTLERLRGEGFKLVVCLNPGFYKPSDAKQVLEEELRKLRERERSAKKER